MKTSDLKVKTVTASSIGKIGALAKQYVDGMFTLHTERSKADNKRVQLTVSLAREVFCSQPSKIIPEECLSATAMDLVDAIGREQHARDVANGVAKRKEKLPKDVAQDAPEAFSNTDYCRVLKAQFKTVAQAVQAASVVIPKGKLDNDASIDVKDTGQYILEHAGNMAQAAGLATAIKQCKWPKQFKPASSKRTALDAEKADAALNKIVKGKRIEPETVMSFIKQTRTLGIKTLTGDTAKYQKEWNQACDLLAATYMRLTANQPEHEARSKRSKK